MKYVLIVVVAVAAAVSVHAAMTQEPSAVAVSHH
jgi:hypothetical protein